MIVFVCLPLYWRTGLDPGPCHNLDGWIRWWNTHTSSAASPYPRFIRREMYGRSARFHASHYSGVPAFSYTSPVAFRLYPSALIHLFVWLSPYILPPSTSRSLWIALPSACRVWIVSCSSF